jgi:cytochrome c553
MNRKALIWGALLLAVLGVLGLGSAQMLLEPDADEATREVSVKRGSMVSQQHTLGGQNPADAARSPIDTKEVIERGRVSFTTLRETSIGSIYACVKCHGADGSGVIGPDIRPSTAAHLLQHAHGESPHPVKFPGLTRSELDDIAAFLKSNCRTDPECEPASVDQHEHGDNHRPVTATPSGVVEPRDTH